MSVYKENYQDLDIMSNFMINQLATDPELKEPFCKMMIRELLHREVGKIDIIAEKIIVGDNPNMRGVRLDVEVEEHGEDGESVANIYDIEPHRICEKDFPKKNRYTQAQIDKKHMKTGDRDFSHMPDLYIINITNYDPYGYDQMVYTIKNTCLEEPDICYNDGVTILYFNTTGTKGGSPCLKNFLNYLEESTAENVVDEATKEAHEYVSRLKARNQEMTTVGDLIDNIIEKETQEIIKAKDEEIKAVIADKNAEIARLKAAADENNESKGLKALVNTLKPILKTPEEVLESIISQEGFENTTIDDVKRYW